nr:MAG TPA: hypothetical protein [Caudoviricetes sp.]
MRIAPAQHFINNPQQSAFCNNPHFVIVLPITVYI